MTAPALLGLLALALPPAPQEEPPSGADAPAVLEPADGGAPSAEPGTGAQDPATTPSLELGRGLSPEAIDAALEGLAGRAGELATLRTLGTSRGGRPVRLLVLTAPGDEEAGGRSALLFAGTGPRSRHDAEAVLALAELLVEERAREPVASLLASHMLLLAPALDPDARAESQAGTAARFEVDFPMGWLPASLRPGAGDTPLSTPATRLAAELLRETPNLALVVCVTDETAAAGVESGAYPGAELPEEDDAVLEALAAAASRSPASGAAALVPWGSIDATGGGFLDYAYQAFGVYPVAWTAPSAHVADPGAREAWAREVARGTLDLALALPRVRIEEDGLVELAPGLWQLDVAVRNAGAIPTLSALAEGRMVSGELRLTLSGARLVATARRSDATKPYALARLHPTGAGAALDGGILAGGETRWLRLVLEAEQGAAVVLTSASARGGSGRLELVLTGS